MLGEHRGNPSALDLDGSKDSLQKFADKWLAYLATVPQAGIDIPVVDPDFGTKFRLRYAGRPAGSPLTMVVKRGGGTLTLRGVLAYATTTPRITEDPAAVPRAVRVRNGILRGTVDR